MVIHHGDTVDVCHFGALFQFVMSNLYNVYKDFVHMVSMVRPALPGLVLIGRHI